MTFEDLLKEYGLAQEFTMDVMHEVEKIPDAVEDDALKGRRDLRGMSIVTIDGEDAKDLDDAVSVEQLANGNILLGVHIADVSHYVREGTALDRDAQARGTSVYLIDQVVPMLPKKLSNGICSLNPQVDRLTLSVFMEITPSGGVAEYDICESVIRTKERMTYKDVTALLEGDPRLHQRYEALVDDFCLMQKLALILRSKRHKRGSLDFDFPEPKFVLDDTGKPTDIYKYEITISNKIIEEFMLVCNETVARHMNKLEIPLVYRVHETPKEDKITAFAVMLKGLGYKARFGVNSKTPHTGVVSGSAGKSNSLFGGNSNSPFEITPRQLQEVLEQIRGKDEELAISTIMLRSLMKARYCDENLGHFGLAAKFYCHFTSPIRRYPDLAVHRIVKEWLQKKPLAESRLKHFAGFAVKVSQESSDAEVNAVEAERAWNDVKMCEYMEDKVGEEFDGFICSVTNFGLFVQLETTVEGLIKMSDLKDDYYMFDEVQHSLLGKRTGTVFRIGDKVRVKVSRVSVEQQQIDFVLTEKEKSGARKEKKDGEKKRHEHHDRHRKGRNRTGSKKNKK